MEIVQEYCTGSTWRHWMTRASKPSTLSKLSRSYPHTASMSSAQTSRKVESNLRPQATSQRLASQEAFMNI